MCHPLPFKLKWFQEFVKKRNDEDFEMEEIGEYNPTITLARKRAEWLAIKEQSLERRPLCYRTPFESRLLFHSNIEKVVNL